MPRRKLLRSSIAKPTRKGLLLASLLHSTNKTANFNPLTSLAHSFATKGFGSDFGRKPYRTAVRPPKRARTSAKKRATRGRKAVIGKDAGMILTGKSPGITKVGATVRQTVFSDPIISIANRAWVGANSIANERFALDLLVEGIMEHLLRRAGDTRANKTSTSGNASRMIFSEIDLVCVRRLTINAGSSTATNPEEIRLQYVVEPQSSSFNGLVYNNIVGASPNLMYVDGTPVPVGEKATFQYQLFEMARAGYYPEFLTLRRKDTGGNTHEVIRDQMFSKMKLKIDIAGRHRFQNVTPASRTDGAMNGMNAMSIDANPLTGKIYTFSNLSPRLNQSWLQETSDTDRSQIQELTARPMTWTQTKYEQLSQIRQDFPDMNAFAAAPLRPRTLFSNVKTCGPVHFPPGGFKTFKTKFTYSGTMQRFLSSLLQTSNDPVANNFDHTAVGKYPTLGDSFMMCLRPTMKTTGDEAVQMAYDFEKIGKIQVSKFTHGTMATTNDIE